MEWTVAGWVSYVGLGWTVVARDSGDWTVAAWVSCLGLGWTVVAWDGGGWTALFLCV